MSTTSDAQSDASIAVFRDGTKADVVAVSSVHRLVFPDYFLSGLGQTAVQCFYSNVIDRPGTDFLSVAEVDGRVVGFVAGTRDSAGLFRKLYRTHFFQLLPGVFRGVFTTRKFREALWSRRASIRVAIRSKVRREEHVSSSEEASAASTRLLTIGMMDGYRKMGMSEKLTDHFMGRLANSGVEKVGLSVFRSNKRAIRFYEKTGWTAEFETSDTIYFLRGTGAVQLDSDD
jgi:ribosomal protein S18 acetylase RimI-like enzyme